MTTEQLFEKSVSKETTPRIFDRHPTSALHDEAAGGSVTAQQRVRHTTHKCGVPLHELLYPN